MKNLKEIKNNILFTFDMKSLLIKLLLIITSYGFGVLCGILLYDSPTGWNVLTLIPLAILIMFIDIITSPYIWILLLIALIVRIFVNAEYKIEK